MNEEKLDIGAVMDWMTLVSNEAQAKRDGYLVVEGEECEMVL